MASVSDIFSVEGKVAVVTGGSRGVGLMIARGLVEAGVRVYISARKADACDATAAELSKVGECVSVPADLSSRAGTKQLAAAVAEREEKVHILVNNAGASWGEPIEEYSEEGFDKVLDTNVKGVFFVTASLLPQLRAAATEEDPARVVNIGSVDGLSVPILESFAYSASKSAVHMLTRHLGRRLVGEHINVNAIAPGFFPSKMTAFMFSTPELETALLDRIPMRRAGAQEDIAGTVIYLCSRAGAYVTGAVLPVGGGLATLQSL
ncbi:MAG: hypothetical protein QOE92_2327 [Chloroflexota bacterium]|jgi:NAD(P)-dependent dehydrogenase (short-subunit alcohol dehydrogenase family)|nr:hypothetical protein [Chloroflexota bacterium]